MGVDFSEVVTLAADLRTAPSRLQPLAKAVSKKTGLATVSDAQVAAPVDTGLLASSVSVDFDTDGLGWTAGPTAEYGGFVEYGTSGPYVIPNAFGRGDFVMHPGIGPQPYMGPAFDRQTDTADNALVQAAKKVLS